MKKVHLLSVMIVVSVAADIHTKSVKNPQVRKLVHQINADTKKLDTLTTNAQVSDWPAVFNILNSRKIDVNEYLSPDGYSLLGIAVETNNVSATKTLLEKYKANPNLYDMNAFMIACEQSSPETNTYDQNRFTNPHAYGPMFTLLLKHGANTNQNLDYAMNNGYPEAVEAIGKYRKDSKILNVTLPLTASRRNSMQHLRPGMGTTGVGFYPSWIPGNQ